MVGVLLKKAYKQISINYILLWACYEGELLFIIRKSEIETDKRRRSGGKSE